MNEKGKDRDCDNKNFYWGIVELKGLFEGEMKKVFWISHYIF